jgi:hypothetical protein
MTTRKPWRSVKRNISKAQQIQRGHVSARNCQVRPKTEFARFRTQDVGKKGGIQRVAEKRSSGSWDTQKWLIEKNLADMKEGRLIPKTQEAEGIVGALGSTPKYRGGDRFEAKPRPNVPKRLKPTKAQRRAQQGNMKAQEARSTSWRRCSLQSSSSVEIFLLTIMRIFTEKTVMMWMAWVTTPTPNPDPDTGPIPPGPSPLPSPKPPLPPPQPDPAPPTRPPIPQLVRRRSIDPTESHNPSVTC